MFTNNGYVAQRLEDHIKSDTDAFARIERGIEKLGGDYTGGLNRLETQVKESMAGRQSQIDDIKKFLTKIMLGVVSILVMALGTILYNALHGKGLF